MNFFSFFSQYATGGDWLVFFPQYIKDLTWFPYIWSPTNGVGLGQNIAFVLGFKTLFAIEAKFFTLFLPWSITEKLIFFLPFWIGGGVGCYLLGKSFFAKQFQRWLLVVIYMLNTYSLMLVGGGQMGVAIAYVLVPWTLACFFFWLKSKKTYNGWIFPTTFFLSLLLLTDSRITLLTIAICFGYLILLYGNKKTFLLFCLSLLFSVLLNAFWVLPTGIVHDIQVSSAYTTANIVKFLSFATFENTLGLLHPNWPENIFGEVTFMRPEFLLLPVLAFSSLMFINFKKKKEIQENLTILFFIFLGLLGIFLSKGTQDPGGFIYFWMFTHIKGFVLFRDPTKWYIFIIVSYSYLIPFSIGRIYDLISSKKIPSIKSNICNLQNIFLLGVVCYLLFLVRPLFLGQLGGTFQLHPIPQDYTKLATFLENDNTFSHTLWVPVTDRFGFFSFIHPSISSYDFFQTTTISATLKKLQTPNTENYLANASIKYIIVPEDNEKEIFLKDRKYDNVQYLTTIHSLQKLSWLHEIKEFGNIHVFKLLNTKPRFWISNNPSVQVITKAINPTKFVLSLKNIHKGDQLIFTDAYDIGWQLQINHQVISTKPYHNLSNSFLLPKSGNYQVVIEYPGQKWVFVGVWVSLVSFVSVIISYMIFYLQKKK